MTLAYLGPMRLAARLSPDHDTRRLAAAFIHSLPIVVAYSVAHYFPS